MAKTKSTLSKEKILFWLPRILIILYILFISLFAFDTPIFSLGFIIHLIPSFILILITILAWRKPKPAGWLFLLIFLLFTLFFKTYRYPLTFLFISLPLLVISLLFLASASKKSSS